MQHDIWMHLDVRGAMLESARECEAEVFLRSFGNTRAQLDDEERASLDAAMRGAIAQLARDVAREPDRAVREVAGVPSAEEAARLVGELDRAVWSAAA